MTTSNLWLERIQAATLPALLPISALPSPEAALSAWNLAMREDPLLALQIMGQANRIFARRDQQLTTLDHAVAVLGVQRLMNLNRAIPRISPGSTAYRGLRLNIGDSLVAAQLMKQWFELRRLPWGESDYWSVLYHNLGYWALWLLEPQKMEAFEQRSTEGRNRTELVENLIEQPLTLWNKRLSRTLSLPPAPDCLSADDLDQIRERLPDLRSQYVAALLPLSHELAYQLRLSWQSPALDRLCKIGATALGIDDFRDRLKVWVPNAARQIRLSEAGSAARLLLAQQPSLSKAGTPAAAPLHRDPRLAETEDTRPPPKPEPRARVAATKPAAPPPASVTVATKRRALNPDVLEDARTRLRRPIDMTRSEIHKTALEGLQSGLGLSRIVLLNMHNGIWQATRTAGCSYYLLLRNLRLPLLNNPVMQEFSRRTAAFWLNDSNRDKGRQTLPADLLKAAADEAFFLRSFKVGNAVPFLVYADAKDDDEELNEHDYRLFRDFCADWNNALTRNPK
ncbi:HDOD domain-containing protein [Saccharospirillum mangrovi]|uniref:HDOD domain-containing protein n=1 Tax=Saccharospirillum mangrovi TaxID=2161747 RepID=UPI000D3B23A5|nr:HDOD domain-containing protein [Saccharospirillum mangrovi]